jgi:predicted nucleic acid-binding protein
VPLYLADTSAWHRSAAVFDRWSELLSRGDIAVSPPVQLELLYSARSARDASSLRTQLSSLPRLSLDERAASTALAVQAQLTEKAQHRGPRPMDLLIAAIAETRGAVVLHYDRHFDTIARVTGQPMEWLARRGSLD